MLGNVHAYVRNKLSIALLHYKIIVIVIMNNIGHNSDNPFAFINKVNRVFGICSKDDSNFVTRIFRLLLYHSIFISCLIIRTIYWNEIVVIDLIVFYVCMVIMYLEIIILIYNSKWRERQINKIIMSLKNVNYLMRLNRIQDNKSNKKFYGKLLTIQLGINIAITIIYIIFWKPKELPILFAYSVSLSCHMLLQNNLTCLLYEVRSKFNALNVHITSIISVKNNYDNKSSNYLFTIYEKLNCTCRSINETFSFYFISEALLSFLVLLHTTFIFVLKIEIFEESYIVFVILSAVVFIKTYNFQILLCMIELTQKEVSKNL